MSLNASDLWVLIPQIGTDLWLRLIPEQNLQNFPLWSAILFCMCLIPEYDFCRERLPRAQMISSWDWTLSATDVWVVSISQHNISFWVHLISNRNFSLRATDPWVVTVSNLQRSCQVQLISNQKWFLSIVDFPAQQNSGVRLISVHRLCWCISLSRFGLHLWMLLHASCKLSLEWRSTCSLSQIWSWVSFMCWNSFLRFFTRLRSLSQIWSWVSSVYWDFLETLLRLR